LAAGLLLAALGFGLGGGALWLLWPAAALLLVAAGQGLLGPGLFLKSVSGRLNRDRPVSTAA